MMGGFSTISPVTLQPVNPNIAFLMEQDKIEYYLFTRFYTRGVIIGKDIYSDRAVETLCFDQSHCAFGRFQDVNNTYYTFIHSPYAGRDFVVEKKVAGTITTLGDEAVDLPADTFQLTRLSIMGSTIKIYREDLSTPKASVTDTSFVSGKYGIGYRDGGKLVTTIQWAYLRTPTSPAPKVIAYFEVELIGSGTSEDPFRPSLPEDIRDGINVLAVTNSILVKTGSDGKPTEYRGILRVFDQPDRPANLLPLSQALDALGKLKGVRKLTREAAIKEAKRLDDKLHDLDLLSARELRLDRKQAAKEYMSWRVHNLGVREELLDVEVNERYVEEDKGW